MTPPRKSDRLTLMPADAHAAEDRLRLAATYLPAESQDEREALIRVANWLEAVREEVIGVLLR